MFIYILHFHFGRSMRYANNIAQRYTVKINFFHSDRGCHRRRCILQFLITEQLVFPTWYRSRRINPYYPCLPRFWKSTGRFQSLRINEVLKQEKDSHRLHGCEIIVEALGSSRLRRIRQVEFVSAKTERETRRKRRKKKSGSVRKKRNNRRETWGQSTRHNLSRATAASRGRDRAWKKLHVIT